MTKVDYGSRNFRYCGNNNGLKCNSTLGRSAGIVEITNGG